MESKFLPNLFRRRSIGSESGPVAHAISGSAAASGGMGFGSSVFATSAGGWDVDRAINEGLERVLYVYRCCDVIASAQAGVPMIVREGDPDDGRVIKDERLFRLLNRRTNIHETSSDFRYRLSIQGLLSKRGAFIEIVTDNVGRPKALELLPPGQVEPIPDPKKFVAGYRLMNQVSLTEEILPPEKVIWVKWRPHPIDPYLQLTPLTAAGIQVDTDFLARLFNRNFLLNDGRPGMLVALRGHMNQTDAEEVKRRLNGGPQNAGRVVVVEADDLNAQDMSASPRDMQWLEAINMTKEDIMLAFGVPESVMGNASGRTYDNADAEKENFWEDTMLPHNGAIARAMDMLTGAIDDDKFLGHDYDKVEVLQRWKRQRHDKLLAEYEAKLITLDEYRAGVGRAPMGVAGARVIWLDNGVILGSDADAQQASQLPQVGMPQQLPGQSQSFGSGGGYGDQAAVGGGDQYGGKSAISARVARLNATKALPRFPYSDSHVRYDAVDDGELEDD